MLSYIAKGTLQMCYEEIHRAKCNHDGSYKTDTRRSKEALEDMMIMEAGSWTDVRNGSQARECSRLQKLERQGGFSPKPLRQNQPCGHLDFSPGKRILDF